MPTLVARPCVVALALALVCVMRGGARAAEPPPTPERLSVATMLGYGAITGGQNPPNVYGLGFGLRIGWTQPSGLYFGGVLLEHQGYSLDGPLPSNRTSPSRGGRTMIGGEVGYEWETPIVYRIYFGVGGLIDRGADRKPDGSFAALTQSSDVGFWPGASVLFPIPLAPRVVVGADVHLTLPGASDAPVGLEFFAVVGTRFTAPW